MVLPRWQQTAKKLQHCNSVSMNPARNDVVCITTPLLAMETLIQCCNIFAVCRHCSSTMTLLKLNHLASCWIPTTACCYCRGLFQSHVEMFLCKQYLIGCSLHLINIKVALAPCHILVLRARKDSLKTHLIQHHQHLARKAVVAVSLPARPP